MELGGGSLLLTPQLHNRTCPPASGGFRHVQHVWPNRGPTKRGPHKRSGNFFATLQLAGNNGRHSSERVKWIKAIVIIDKRSPVFSRKNRVRCCRWGAPHFFLNRAVLRLNPALPPAVANHYYTWCTKLSRKQLGWKGGNYREKR